jgi:hypothetical protein
MSRYRRHTSVADSALPVCADAIRNSVFIVNYLPEEDLVCLARPSLRRSINCTSRRPKN